MDWKKELKETNWLFLLFTLAMAGLFISVLWHGDQLNPMPPRGQYVLAVGLCFLLGRVLFKKRGD